MKRLQERFVHKDGIWLVPFSHLNCDAIKVEIWQDDKNVDTKEYVYGYYKPEEGHTIVGDALEYAHEMSKELNLPIIDGSGVEYYTFPQEYRRTDYRTHDSWKPVVDDPDVEEYKYTDQELDDMDERPRHTIKWAICQGPNLFRIYDNIQKNPNRFWDTEMYRGMCGSSGNIVKDFEDFFEKHADKVYEGTWEDIKDGEYVVIVHGRRYTSKEVKKIFDASIAAGLEINGRKVKGEIHTGEYERVNDYDCYGEYNHDVEIVISFDEVPNLDDGWSGDREEKTKKVLRKYTQVYDALTCAGLFFPEEFVVSYDGGESGKPKEYLFQIDDNDTLHVGKEEKYNDFKTLQVGDVVSLRQTGSWNSERLHPLYYVVIEVGKKTAKIARVSCKLTTNDSPWGYSEYDYTTIISPRYYEDALKGIYVDSYSGRDKIPDVKTINLLDNDCSIRYRAGSEELMNQFRDAMYTCGIFGRARYYYKSDLIKAHAPENPEEFFGEPLLLTQMTSSQKESYKARQKQYPKFEADMTSYMDRSGFTFDYTKEDEENDNWTYIVYKRGKDRFIFKVHKYRLEYKIRVDANDHEFKYGGDSAEEFEKDLIELLEKIKE